MPPKGKGRGKGKKSKAAPRGRQRSEDDDDSTRDKDYVHQSSDDDSEEHSDGSAIQQPKSSKPQQKKRRKDLDKDKTTTTTVPRTTTTTVPRTNISTPEPSLQPEDARHSSAESEVSEAAVGKNTTKRSAPLQLDKEKEANLAEWYQGHPLFFDKRHPEHANRTKKEGLIADKARELDLDPVKLATWFKNQRDRVNALAKKVTKRSGDPDNDDDLEALTEREKEVYRGFKFLREYITPHRRPSKTAGLKSTPTPSVNVPSGRPSSSSSAGGPSAAAGSRPPSTRPSAAESITPTMRDLSSDDEQVPPAAPSTSREGNGSQAVYHQAHMYGYIQSINSYLGDKYSRKKKEDRRKRALAEAVYHEADSLKPRLYSLMSEETYSMLAKYSRLQRQEEEALSSESDSRSFRGTQRTPAVSTPSGATSTPTPSQPVEMSSTPPPPFQFSQPTAMKPTVQQQSSHSQQQPQYYGGDVMMPPPQHRLVAPPTSAPPPPRYISSGSAEYSQVFSPISPAGSTTPAVGTTNVPTTSSSGAARYSTPSHSPLPPSVSQQPSPAGSFDAGSLFRQNRTSTPVYATRDSILPQGPNTPGSSASDILRAALAQAGGIGAADVSFSLSDNARFNDSYGSLLRNLPSTPTSEPPPQTDDNTTRDDTTVHVSDQTPTDPAESSSSDNEEIQVNDD